MKQTLGPLIDWCWTCSADTEHYRTTRSPKMLALGVTCKRCRQLACSRMSAKAARVAEAPARTAAREQRRSDKLKLEAEAIATRQAARIAAKHAPRYCPRCNGITERADNKCVPCRQRRDAVRRARNAREQELLRVAATPTAKQRHIANPQAPCPSGHHEWNAQGYCRACLRLKNKHNRTDVEKLATAMWKRAKHRAERKGLKFNIAPDDCRVPDDCAVFGPMDLNTSGLNRMGPSLDRIKPELGYVKGNVIVISGLANTIKNCWTRSQVRAVADCDAIWPKAA